MQVCDYFYCLIEVIEGNNGIEEHEERFRDLEDVSHVPFGARLEIANAIIANVAYGASSERREAKMFDDGFAMLRELSFEVGKRVLRRAMAQAGLEDLARVCSSNSE